MMDIKVHDGISDLNSRHAESSGELEYDFLLQAVDNCILTTLNDHGLRQLAGMH
jgi:hypothetical protein